MTTGRKIVNVVKGLFKIYLTVVFILSFHAWLRTATRNPAGELTVSHAIFRMKERRFMCNLLLLSRSAVR